MPIIWNFAPYDRSLPGKIKLKPGRNAVPDGEWEQIKGHPRVRELLAAGQDGGIAEMDLRLDVEERIKAGEPITIVNELPINVAVAFVNQTEDAGLLKQLLNVVRYPQVAQAITRRLRLLDSKKSRPGKKRRMTGGEAEASGT